jgi:nitroreductase
LTEQDRLFGPFLEESLMSNDTGRLAAHPVHPVFLDRWSPRAFTGEQIGEAELATILEAGRWAPSAYNAQPWRFLYARKGSAAWDAILGLLLEFNQLWAREAAVLIVMVSREKMLPPGASAEIASHSHSFDAGAAWANIALQATLSGWHAHAMVGFDMPRSREVLNIPADYRVEAAIAIGRRGPASLLPEKLAAREKPSDRLALADIALEGGFPKQD